MSEQEPSFIENLIKGMKVHQNALVEEQRRNFEAGQQLKERYEQLETEIDALLAAIQALEKARPAKTVVGPTWSNEAVDIDPGIREHRGGPEKLYQATHDSEGKFTGFPEGMQH